MMMVLDTIGRILLMAVVMAAAVLGIGAACCWAATRGEAQRNGIAKDND